MVRPFKAALNVEQNGNGEFEWVLTAIDSTVGTMPQVERSASGYPTEEEARRAGEAAMERLRDD
jgi:hypothetical protein